jgi:hypothetical protein
MTMITRRDFLKMGGTGLLGMLLLDVNTGFAQENSEDPIQRGRVLYWNLPVRTEPNISAPMVSNYKRDNLLPIMGRVFGGVEGEYNRWWFKIGHEGYSYSGGIQLVETRLNGTRIDLPESGILGEITVPYSESYWRTSGLPYLGSLMYYGTTHWIQGIEVDRNDGSVWYKAYDHLYEKSYFLRPAHVRIIPPEEITPISQNFPPAEKYIEVILDQQIVRAYEGDRCVFVTKASTGKGVQKTPTGWFRTFHKRPTAHMVGGRDVDFYYDLPGVPWDTYITEDAVAFHGTYWHNDFGTPHSYGCINLSIPAAKWIYRWTYPSVPYDQRYILNPGRGVKVQILEQSLASGRQR